MSRYSKLVAEYSLLYAILIPISIVLEILVAAYISIEFAIRAVESVPGEMLRDVLYRGLVVLEPMLYDTSGLTSAQAGVYYAMLTVLFFVMHFLPSITVMILLSVRFVVARLTLRKEVQTSV